MQPLFSNDSGTSPVSWLPARPRDAYVGNKFCSVELLQFIALARSGGMLPASTWRACSRQRAQVKRTRHESLPVKALLFRSRYESWRAWLQEPSDGMEPLKELALRSK